MRSIEVALLELKRLTSARPFRLAVAVVCLVPLLYGVLYLWAFWDPYQRLDKLPVALVVSDTPAHVDGATLHVGKDLVAELRKSETFDWRLVSAPQASKGLEDGTYYMALTVPKDFSTRLAHADSDHPKKAQLLVQANEGTNLLASQIGSRIFLELRASLSAVTSQKYLDHIFVGLGDARTGLERAGSGAGRLANALGSASSGSRTLARGIGSADSGARTLNSGLSKLSSGAAKLHSGAASAASGAGKLAAGVRAASSGARSVAAGSKTVATGSQSLADGLVQLGALSQTLVSSASSLSGGASQVQSGVESAASQTGQAASAAGQLSSGAAQVKQALAALAQTYPDVAREQYYQAALAGAGQVSAGSAQLASELGSGQGRLQTLAGGAAQVTAGAGKLADGLTSYSDAVGRASAGAQKLSSGASQLSGGASQLAGGVNAASSASDQLAAGTSALASGSAELAGGASSASSGSATLTVGLDKLTAGGGTLSAGLGKAASGSKKLAGALDTGAAGIPAFTRRARVARARMMSAPVELTTRREDPVPNYGTGFAPYFIPLALWVGALMAYFLVRPLGGRALASTLRDPYVALSGLWPGVVITWLQAVVMLVVLQVFLGLDPVQPIALYAFTLVAALTFTAILQLLSAAFGTAGKFVAVVLLMLQLTSAAGTFPLQLVPKFFQVINPLLPMTYVVTGLRQAISGGDLPAVSVNGLILLGYAIAAVGLTVLTAHRRRTWTMDRLKPVLNL
jgi:putative membrane protein